MDEFTVFHELYDKHCELNKLIEQSETFANQFYGALDNFIPLKPIESEKTNKKEESCDSIKIIEPEITAKENVKLYGSLNKLEPGSPINKEIGKLNFRKELDFVLARKKEMKNDDLINQIESNIANKKGIWKSNSLKESEYELIRRKELRRFDSTNQINSKNINNKEIEMFHSLKKTESLKLCEINSMILNKEIATRKEILEFKPIKKTEPVIVQVKEERNFKSIKEIESENATRIVFKEYKEKCENLINKFQNLKNKFGKCEILIFGKVSTGKSKIINAILGEEIFQSASSHTTSCFVKICKSSDQYHYIGYGNKQVSYTQLDDVKNKIKEMSTVFSNDKNRLDTNELLSVYLNIPDNKILTPNIEIIDCPGSANKESITNYIKDKALNANIFIFVLTSGITDDDEAFFQYQWEQSSKPIIFILVNKWDQAYNDGDDVAEECKKEITEGLFKFLTQKIKLSPIDVKKRIYFVSALNICKKRNIGKGNSKKLDEYEEERCQKFESFEKSLSQFIKTFIKQKFKNYEAEFKELENEIQNSTKNFKSDFLKHKNIENLESLGDFRNEIKISLDAKRSKINTVKENSLNQIKEFVNTYESKLNRTTIKSIENVLNTLIIKNTSLFGELKIEIYEFIDGKIKNYKKLTNIDKEKKTLQMKESMKKEITLPTVSNTTWEDFCNKFISFFTFLRENFYASLYKKDAQFLKETHDKIDSAINDLKEYVEDYLDSLFAYLTNEINEIIDHLNYKMNLYSEYSTNINNLFQDSKKIG